MPKRPYTRKGRKATKKGKPYRRPRKYARKYKPKASLGYSLFPRVNNTTLVYRDTASMTSGGIINSQVARFRLNGMFDFDYDNTFQNKQPLYFDTLLTSTGPYREFKVNAWKTTFKIVNMDATRALSIYYDPGTINDITSSDSPSEMKNRAGVISRLLTPLSGSKATCTISSYKTTKNFLAQMANDFSFSGTYLGDPVYPVFGTLLSTPVDGTIASHNIQVEVRHIFYVTLFEQDSTLS